MRANLIVLAVLCTVLRLPLRGQEPLPPLRLSLSEAQEYALKYSAEARNARLDVLAAEKKVWETTASGLPQVSAKLSYVDNLKIPTTLIPAKFFDPDAAETEFIGVRFGTQHNASLDLTATQLVFNGSYFVALQASRVYLQISQNQREKKEIDLRESVAGTYSLILLAEKNRDILRSTLENLRQTHFEVQELNRAGFTESTDVDQLLLSVTDLENSLGSVERQLDMAYRMLRFQLGLDLERPLELSDTLPGIVSRIDADTLLESPLDLPRHIDYRILDNQVKSMNLLLKREKSEFLPTVSAFLSHSQSAMRDRFNFFNRGEKWFPATMVGFNLTVPLFTSGLRGARVAQARIELEKSENLKRQVADGLRLGLAQARSEFTDSRAREASTAKSVELALRIYENTRAKHGKGLSTTQELTQVHNQYLNAESGHIQAMVALLNAKTKLEKALSRL